MKPWHILNGDCLADQLRKTNINHDFIVCRECLIDGNLNAASLSDFWTIRANFIAENYNITVEEYFNRTVSEFEKLNLIPDNSEVSLWFENDLFCQANMWFVISILSNRPTLKLFRVFPIIENEADLWKGFGNSNPEKLEQSYNAKIQFTPYDLELGKSLWAAYQNDDFEKLKELALSQSGCFEYLKEVCQAHTDRFPPDKTAGRPDRIVKEIIETRSEEFQIVFSEFTMREGIYGFGDLQLRIIYDRVMQNR